MKINYPTFLAVVGAMREQGIVHKHMPVALDLVRGLYQPNRFYWDSSEPEVNVMISGPIYRNDNHF